MECFRRASLLYLYFCCTLTGSHVISIQIGFTQLFDNLSTDINELKGVVYNFFLNNTLQTLPSDSRALYAQPPIFVVEIMAQRSASDLFHLLKSKTPYSILLTLLQLKLVIKRPRNCIL